jgi:hypothetical protein
MEFAFDKEAKESFPRQHGRDSVAYADFAILNKPNTNFQIMNLSMKFDYIHFQWHAGAHSQVVGFCFLFIIIL